ncbi:MAG: Hpt domain-containing protein [Fibrobacter sp.]|nr:Hpt domain-containing protein [Fibrobacter sp.]
MITIGSLNAFGANTEEGLARCMGNEALYLKLVGVMLADKNFDKLRSAIESGNLDEAFEAAHALKGALGNLALTPLYKKAASLTELLRNRAEADYGGLVSDLLTLRDKLSELCA